MATQKEIEYLQDNFDLKSLYEIGLFSKFIHPRNYDLQIERICNYFGITNIFQYDTIGIDDNKYIVPDLKTFSQN